MMGNYMVQISLNGKTRQMFARTFGSADRAYDRIVSAVQSLTCLPNLTVSLTDIRDGYATCHYAEAHGGRMTSKKYWNPDDWERY